MPLVIKTNIIKLTSFTNMEYFVQLLAATEKLDKGCPIQNSFYTGNGKLLTF